MIAQIPDLTILRSNYNSENPFKPVASISLKDESLSLKARGLLVYLLSNADNWVLNIEQLIDSVSIQDGATCVRAAIKELKDAGYIIMSQVRSAHRIVRNEIVVKEIPTLANSSKSHILRAPHDSTHNYVCIPNSISRNTELSLKSRGLLCYLLSFPDSWHFSVEFLSKALKEGACAIKSGLKELKRFGHYLPVRIRDSVTKQFIGWVNYIFEVPNAQNPVELEIQMEESRKVKNPKGEKPTYIINNEFNKHEFEKILTPPTPSTKIEQEGRGIIEELESLEKEEKAMQSLINHTNSAFKTEMRFTPALRPWREEATGKIKQDFLAFTAKGMPSGNMHPIQMATSNIRNKEKTMEGIIALQEDYDTFTNGLSTLIEEWECAYRTPHPNFKNWVALELSKKQNLTPVDIAFKTEELLKSCATASMLWEEFKRVLDNTCKENERLQKAGVSTIVAPAYMEDRTVAVEKAAACAIQISETTVSRQGINQSMNTLQPAVEPVQSSLQLSSAATIVVLSTTQEAPVVVEAANSTPQNEEPKRLSKEEIRIIREKVIFEVTIENFEKNYGGTHLLMPDYKNRLINLLNKEDVDGKIAIFQRLFNQENTKDWTLGQLSNYGLEEINGIIDICF
jgi:hypothetical protein